MSPELLSNILALSHLVLGFLIAAQGAMMRSNALSKPDISNARLIMCIGAFLIGTRGTDYGLTEFMTDEDRILKWRIFLTLICGCLVALNVNIARSLKARSNDNDG